MSWDSPRDEDESFLQEAFEANFERLREQSGHSLAPFVKEAARQQVLLYYRRLKGLAEAVRETEVRLVLPDQESPAGRRYTLEGVVDIVGDGERTVMYDIKSYLDADAAREHIEPHYRQLNVYAHIWAGLRGAPLDAVALIATRPTRPLSAALRSRDPVRIEAALQAWQPVLDVPVEVAVVAEVMYDFGVVVDQIEERRFSPPPMSVLKGPTRPGGKALFSQDVCLNCDGRFSCAAWRQLLRSQSPGRAEAALREATADFGGDTERDQWRDSEPETSGRITPEGA